MFKKIHAKFYNNYEYLYIYFIKTRKLFWKKVIELQKTNDWFKCDIKQVILPESLDK